VKVPEFRRHVVRDNLPDNRRNAGTALATSYPQEAVMSHVLAPRSIGSFVINLFEHAFFVIAGFVFMVAGVGLSVTMVMLPVGLPVGLLGFAMFIGGMTVRMDRS
jgi:hypothetical protein